MLRRPGRRGKGELQDVSVTVSKAAGDNEKLFGSVTTQGRRLRAGDEGVTLDRRRIVIGEPIKSLGVYTVSVKFRGDQRRSQGLGGQGIKRPLVLSKRGAPWTGLEAENGGFGIPSPRAGVSRRTTRKPKRR